MIFEKHNKKPIKYKLGVSPLFIGMYKRFHNEYKVINNYAE
ncbi:hypothetical protein [Caudoviricetes sp.]|nr:hypothetical protein [Caudoviricetes sp.]